MPAKHNNSGQLQCNFLAISLALLILALSFAAGCGGKVKVVKTTAPSQKPVVRDAAREELLEKYNAAARAVNSLNCTVELKPIAGSKYSGVIEEYHEVKAFLLAQRPAGIRMIGQAPIVGSTVFDMASDGETFRVSIPSKNKFLVGSVALERARSKPIENLRPQHLLEALLWPEIRKEESVLFEEFNEETARYYVLTVLRGGYQTEIVRKVWFDRSNLELARLQSFGPRGFLISDAHISNWQPVDAAAAGAAPSPAQQFPRSILLERPHDDYRLDLQFAKVIVNVEIPAERFHLEQPAGAEVIQVGESPAENQPRQDARPQGARR